MAKKLDITQIDRNMAVKIASHDGKDWYPPESSNFELTGFLWHKPGTQLRRLPLNTKELGIPEGVDWLAWETAGGMLRFRSDALEICVKAKVDHESRMDHMTFDGSMGFDLYVGTPGSKHFAKNTRFDQAVSEYNCCIFSTKIRAMREFTIHFPLYSGVIGVEFGFTEGAKFRKPTPWKDPRPVIVYGTSIQQGGCASRPGMCHTNILSRLLNRPFVNLAFSGSGKGEPEMAKILASIKDPAMYILDYDANAGTAGLRSTLANFCDILRKAHPETPILTVSRTQFSNEAPDLGNEPAYVDDRLSFTETHLANFKRMRAAGDRNIHFVDGTSLLGGDYTECTVDGCHCTDLGFYRIAHALAPEIERILG